jgi:hypothetical protein
MQLYDPTSSGPERNLSRAAALASLEGKTIGILENSKLNAMEMLREVADLFVARPGGNAGQRRRGNRFPDYRPGRLRLLLDVQFA